MKKLCVLFLFSFPLFAGPSNEPKIEISPGVSFYNGDSLRTFTAGSVALVYHFNRSFWLGADFIGGALKVDIGNGLNLKSNDKFFGTDLAVYWNIPALLDATWEDPTTGFGADLYTSIGLGHLWIGRGKEIFGFIGGGLLIHLPPQWFQIKFDLKNLFYHLKNTNGSSFNSDMTLSLGPTFIF